MKKALTIAFPGRDFGWSGGTDLLRHIANGLLSVAKDHSLRLFLLIPVKNRIDSVADFRWVVGSTARRLLREGKFISPRREPVFDSTFLDYFRNVDGPLEIVEYNEATGLVPALRRIGADVVMPAARSLGEAFPFPWVGYVYDFQHRYYPRYFSTRECLSRDIHFATMLRDAKAVIVNAKSVKADIDKFFPYRECEVFNLPFSAAPVSAWLESDDSACLEKYSLPPRYFLISNQFWIHKSHVTAFRALAILIQEEACADLHIVCTGKMEDYRFPDHIRGLQGEVAELGVKDKVHFLGHIPKTDQIAVMKKSLAVIQPTLFEGGPGGGSAYDAISLGVPVILSDIPINREIEDEENLFFFEAGSPADLAETIKDFLQQDIIRPEKAELIARGERRKRLLGERLLEAARHVLEG